MITYDNAKCTKCGLCLEACHEHCIELTDEGIRIHHDLCSTCTHCIAICPQQAVSWNQVPAQKINRTLLPTSEQIKEFLKSRRSDFYFTNRKIDRELLKDIAVMGKYSPTNNYEMDVIVVDSLEVIGALEKLCYRKVNLIDRFIFRFRPMAFLGKWLSPEFKKADAKIKAGRHKKEIFAGATALIFVIGDSRIWYTELSAQYFPYNMQLYAKTWGIGSRPSGGGKLLLAGNKTARKLLDIPKHKSIQGLLFLGYPSLQYINKAEGIAPFIHFK
jgi:NAD-dependent dihydropyrimidine dehydrogenase PreA subunit/nitroreductase